jgi:uncharacterized protein YndB with AHSA1/START domain
MKIALLVVAVLLALVLAIVGIGYTLPVKHRASRQLTVLASPDSVFDAITRPTNFPAWRSKVTKVEMVTSPTGVTSYREHGSDGPLLLEVEESVRPSRLVTRIADKSLPFGGAWTFELTPAADGTTVRITEDGEVYNPLFRFVSRFVMGHTSSIDAYLTDLGKRFGMAGGITPA